MVLMLAVCTAVSELMAPHLDLANIIMVYLAGVVYIALSAGVLVSAVAVGISIFLFDLMYVPPRWGLNPLNPSHFFTFAVMLVVGLLISRLAGDARSQSELAQDRARRAQALVALSGRLASATTRDAIEAAVASAVQDTFGVGALLVLLPEPSPAAVWTAPLRGTAEPLGRLVLVAQPASPPDQADQEMLAAFAHQAALALERCAFEEKSTEARVEAEAERLRSTLLAGISHDFRTPLTTIVGAATALVEQGERLDVQRRGVLTNTVLGEARRLHRVMSDLLDLTRLEGGAVRLNHEWCPADDLVAEALAAVGKQRLATHRVALQVPGDAVVWCDPRLVEQALVNMVDNALRHTPAGSTIRIGVVAESTQWWLQVADDGAGLPRGQEHEVFQKFQRARSEPSGGGFGLGLAICAAVAALHGGAIHAVNRGGACFTMTLPQAAQARRLSGEIE
jgi:two-component system sensor histidine kinase KdpD